MQDVGFKMHMYRAQAAHSPRTAMEKGHGRVREGSGQGHGRVMEGSWKGQGRVREGHRRVMEGAPTCAASRCSSTKSRATNSAACFCTCRVK